MKSSDSVPFFRQSPQKMGANQSESKSVGSSLSDNDLQPCGLLPQCVDCSPICEPNSSMSIVTGNKTSPKQRPSVGNHNPRFERRHSERNNSQVFGNVESGNSASSSPRFEKKHSIHEAHIGSPLSGSIELPADWSKGQQEQLQKAVEEVSLSQKVRIPRIRVMQELMKARADGTWVNSAYDLR